MKSLLLLFCIISITLCNSKKVCSDLSSASSCLCAQCSSHASSIPSSVGFNISGLFFPSLPPLSTPSHVKNFYHAKNSPRRKVFYDCDCDNDQLMSASTTLSQSPGSGFTSGTFNALLSVNITDDNNLVCGAVSENPSVMDIDTCANNVCDFNFYTAGPASIPLTITWCNLQTYQVNTTYDASLNTTIQQTMPIQPPPQEYTFSQTLTKN